MSFSADFLAKANKGYAAAQDALEKELAEKESESKPTQKFNFGRSPLLRSRRRPTRQLRVQVSDLAPQLPHRREVFRLESLRRAAHPPNRRSRRWMLNPPRHQPARPYSVSQQKPEEVKAEKSDCKEKTEKPEDESKVEPEEEKKTPVPTAAPPMSFGGIS